MVFHARQQQQTDRPMIELYLDSGLPPGEEMVNLKSHIHLYRATQSAMRSVKKETSTVSKWSMYYYVNMLFKQSKWLQQHLQSKYNILSQNLIVVPCFGAVKDADGAIRARVRELTGAGKTVTILTKDSDLVVMLEGTGDVQVSFSHQPTKSILVTPSIACVHRAVKLVFGWSDYPSLYPQIPPQLKQDALRYVILTLVDAHPESINAQLVIDTFLEFQRDNKRKTKYDMTAWFQFVAEQCASLELGDEYRIAFCKPAFGPSPKILMDQWKPDAQQFTAQQHVDLLDLRTAKHVLLDGLNEEQKIHCVPKLARALDIAIYRQLPIHRLSIRSLCELVDFQAHDMSESKRIHQRKVGYIQYPTKQKPSDGEERKANNRLLVREGVFVPTDDHLRQAPYLSLSNAQLDYFKDFMDLIDESDYRDEREGILGRVLASDETVAAARNKQIEAVQDFFAVLEDKVDMIISNDDNDDAISIANLTSLNDSIQSLSKTKSAAFRSKGMTGNQEIGNIEDVMNPVINHGIRTKLVDKMYRIVDDVHLLQLFALKKIKDALTSTSEQDWDKIVKSNSEFVKGIRKALTHTLRPYHANAVVAGVFELFHRSIFVHLPLLLSLLPDTLLTERRIVESIKRITGKTLTEIANVEEDEDALANSAVSDIGSTTTSTLEKEKHAKTDKELATVLVEHLGVEKESSNAATIANIRTVSKESLFALFQRINDDDRLKALPLFNKFQLGDAVIEFSHLITFFRQALSLILNHEGLKVEAQVPNTLSELNLIAWKFSTHPKGKQYFPAETIAAMERYRCHTPYETKYGKPLGQATAPWIFSLVFNVFCPDQGGQSEASRLNRIQASRAPNLGHSIRISGNRFCVTTRHPVSPNRANAYYNKFGDFNDTGHWLYSPDRTVGDLYQMTTGIDLKQDLSGLALHRVAYTIKKMFHDPVQILKELTTNTTDTMETDETGPSHLYTILSGLIADVKQPARRIFNEETEIFRPNGVLPTDKQVTSVPKHVLQLYSFAGVDPSQKCHKVSVLNFGDDILEKSTLKADPVPWFVYVTLTLKGKPHNKHRKRDMDPFPIAPADKTLDSWDHRFVDLCHSRNELGTEYYREEKAGRVALRKLDDRSAAMIHRLSYTLPSFRSAPESDELTDQLLEGGERLPILCFGMAKFPGVDKKHVVEVCARSMPVIMVDEHLTSQACPRCCSISEKVEQPGVVGNRLFACPNCNSEGGMYHKDDSASVLIAQKVYFAMRGKNFNSCSRMYNRLNRDKTKDIWDNRN
eukprot:TRINITY_DN25_c0_g1_i5.p1 TRINITY_DN25_c0_g1~~TRINITY_DN25_c0_g1_i5.p1  ORF type:complete len:1462 (-),score=328.75 TRINITY_DN25_c0_g1_i5:98-3910(-)